ncbi:MAG TPA: MFS transporter [Longimicrobium sp.]|jgi:MFS family permease|nr:MFS transporter [Longimicrobium sp.]
MAEPAEQTSWRESLGEMRSFLVIWVGQFVSALGSGLTGFAIPVVVFQKTGSAEQFGLLLFAWILPALLLAPVAGTLVDRWDRRRVLIAADTGSAVMTLLLAGLVLSGRFELWYLFLATVLASLISAFQEPAFTASIAALVPRRQYARAIGLVQLLGSTSAILAPLIAGALVVTIGLGGIMLIDAATFVAAIAGLLLVSIPRPPRIEADAPAAEGPAWRAAGRRFLHEAAQGLHFLRARPGLFGMLAVFALTNFWGGFLNPLLSPMVLSFAQPVKLATVQAAAGAGSVLGGLAIGIWGGPRRRIAAVAGSLTLGGLCTVVIGLRPSVPLIAGSVFVWALSSPMMTASSSAIWMSKTPQALLGRVFAVRRMVAGSMMPLAVLMAGPLAERVFEPLLVPGGALAASVGAGIGVGKGRGIALMFVLIGGLMALTGLAAWVVPSIRHVERDVPDAPHAPHAPPTIPAAPQPAGEELEVAATG